MKGITPRAQPARKKGELDNDDLDSGDKTTFTEDTIITGAAAAHDTTTATTDTDTDRQTKYRSTYTNKRNTYVDRIVVEQ